MTRRDRGDVTDGRARFLAEQFEEHRARLRAVAYRMLGSPSEADDAVQETWLRLSRSDATEIENLGGWLTTVIARVLPEHAPVARHAARGAAARPRPRPVVEPRRTRPTPSTRRVLADSVGLALLVVLETLPPAERLAFVLHDMFAVPFDEIAPMVGPIADGDPSARQPGPPAGAGRRRHPTPTSAGSGRWSTRSSPPRATATSTRWWRCSTPTSCCGPTAARRGRATRVRPRRRRRSPGAPSTFSLPRATLRPALVNGAAGVVVLVRRKPFSVMGFTVGRRQGGVDRRARRSGSARGPRSVGAGWQRRVVICSPRMGPSERSPTRPSCRSRRGATSSWRRSAATRSSSSPARPGRARAPSCPSCASSSAVASTA